MAQGNKAGMTGYDKASKKTRDTAKAKERDTSSKQGYMDSKGTFKSKAKGVPNG